MKKQLYSILTALLLCSCWLSSCTPKPVIPHAERKQVLDRLEKKIRIDFFYHYEQAIQQATKLIEIDPYHQTANYILGEYFFFKSEHKKAYNHLITALEGTNSHIALSALSLIREMYVSLESAKMIASIQPSCDEPYCRALLFQEKWDWASILGKNTPCENELFVLDNFVFLTDLDERKAGRFISGYASVKETSNIEKSYTQMASFESYGIKKITLPQGSSDIYLGNYFGTVKNSLFHIYSTFTVEKSGLYDIAAGINVPYKIYIDGRVLDETTEAIDNVVPVTGARSLQLEKGTHSLLIKLAPYLNTSATVSFNIIPVKPEHNIVFSASTDRAKGTFETVVKVSDYDMAVRDNLYHYFATASSDFMFHRDDIKQWESLYARINGTVAPSVLYRLGKEYVSIEERGRFLTIFNFLMNNYPSFLLIQCELAEFYLTAGDYKRSQNILSEIAPDRRSNLIYLLRKADLYFFRKWSSYEIDIAEKLIDHYAQYPTAWLYASDAYANIGDMKTYVDMREHILSDFPAYLPVINALIEQYQKNSDVSRLQDLYERLLSIEGHSNRVLLLLGDLAFGKQDFDLAENYFKKVLQLNEESFEALYRLGDVYMFKKQKEKAYKYYKKAYEIKPESNMISSKMAVVYDQEKNSFFTSYKSSDDIVLQKVNAYNRENEKENHKYVIIYDEGVQRIFYNGTVRSQFRIAVKLLNKEGVREYSNIYNPGKLIQARVIREDGTIKNSARTDLNRIIFKSLEVGDTVDYTIETTETSASWLNGSNFIWYFATEAVRNLKSTITIYVPTDMDIYFYTRGPVKKEILDKNDNRTIYRYATEDLFLDPAEPDMPPLINFIPILSYSTIASWDDFAAWQTQFIHEQTVHNDEISTKVNDLLKGVVEKETKIKVLRDYVARELRYLYNDRGIFKVKPQPTNVTFTRDAGDCKDKVLLLKQMLSIAGIQSYYSLVKRNSQGALIKELPYMQFDHALAYIPEQEGVAQSFFVDATADYDYYKGINPELEGSDVLIIRDDFNNYRFENVSTATQNKISLNFIKDSSIWEFSLYGIASSYARYRYFSDSDKGRYIKTLLSSFSYLPIRIKKVSLKSELYSEPLIFTIDTQAFSPAIISSTMDKYTQSEKRVYPLVLYDKVSTYHFEIPRKDNITSYIFDNEFFYYKIAAESERIIIDVNIKKKVIKPEEFELFRNTIATLMEIENNYRNYK